MKKRPSHPGDSRSLVMLAAAAALDKKAEDLAVFDVDALSGYADYFLLASGRSTRQTAAIAERIERVLKKAGIKPLGVDGLKEGRWALLDFGDVVVHVFHSPVREFYDLDSLWADAPKLELEPEALAGLIPKEEGQ
jgi:ribosome-associated protein